MKSSLSIYMSFLVVVSLDSLCGEVLPIFCGPNLDTRSIYEASSQSHGSQASSGNNVRAQHLLVCVARGDQQATSRRLAGLQ